MSRTLIGLDIGTHTIKAVQLNLQKNQPALHAAGFIPTPRPAPSVDAITFEHQLAASINHLIHDMKVSTVDVSASLPSSKVVTRIIEIPIISDKELDSSIQWEAEQFIPWQLSKVKIDYAIISSNVEKKKMKVLLVAAPLELIEFYMRIINQAGLNPVALETEILSVTRSVTYSLPTVSNALVLSFGAANIEIALLHQKDLILTKSFPVGGNTITRALAEELGFETLQAEEYKKTYGMDEAKLEGKIAKIIGPLLSAIFTDMEKSIVYFREQYPTEDVTMIAITGGSAKLPGLVSHITKYFGLDCQLFNPLTNLYVDPSIASILNPDAPYYTAAIGLALKEI